MKVALLGAGHIGREIATLLHSSMDFELKIIDSNQAALDNVDLPVEKICIFGPNDSSERMKAMAGCDAVINALPHFMNQTVMEEAWRSWCHYFDLSEDVHSTMIAKNLSANSSTVFMPQCGLAPGFVNIAAHSMTEKFDTVYDVKLRVGALPQFPTNALKYNLTWSIDGLINEYCNPGEAIYDGRFINTLPFEGLEHFTLDGIEYEAFNTSGGLGSLCSSLFGKVRNLDYKTARYPGHCDIMKMLYNDFQLKNDRDTLKQILLKSVPTTERDVVLVFVSVTGERNGKLVQDVFSKKIYADVFSSAIQITTAAGLCTAIDLFREGKLPQKGFIKQEQIGLSDFLNNRFGKKYA